MLPQLPVVLPSQHRSIGGCKCCATSSRGAAIAPLIQLVVTPEASASGWCIMFTMPHGLAENRRLHFGSVQVWWTNLTCSNAIDAISSSQLPACNALHAAG